MFRSTIRDVLWLTALVAVAAGWAVDRWRWHENVAAQLRLYRLELNQKYGLGITWDGEAVRIERLPPPDVLFPSDGIGGPAANVRE